MAMKLIRLQSKELQKLYNRSFYRRKRVERAVRTILEDVRANGDDAVIKYTKKFDDIRLTPRQLAVSKEEITGAYQNIKPDFVAALKLITDNVNRFYRRQLRRSWKMKDADGAELGESYSAIESVGVYVPSGTVPLVSTVYMTVLPAKIAGVRRVIITTPPNEEGGIDPHILVVADLLKVSEIYKIGGAQAIGALAFGTKTIPKVDKIVGPGNEYVTEAKRQVFGFVDIDMMAGPTEVLIVASRNADPDFVAADLKAQAEHVGGLAVLVTNSKSLVKKVKNDVGRGYIIHVKNLNQAVEVVNQFAPEHLQLMVQNPKKLLRRVKNAGAIFLGPYTPTAVGDYVAGPSHVLPTAGTSRFFSGLGISDFIKSSHVISYSRKALEKVKEPLEKLTRIEGLVEHMNSVKVRFKT